MASTTGSSDRQEFDPIVYSSEELVPLLQAICRLTTEDGDTDQERFFSGILSGLERAQDATDLADPFMELSMSAFVGFRFSPSVAFLLDQLLAKAQRLTEVLSLDAETVN